MGRIPLGSSVTKEGKSMSILNGAFFGGLMLILGNILVFKGQVYRSVQMFLLADIAWLWMAISAGDISGIVMVSIGVIISLAAFWKMYKGKFYKTITKD